MTLDFSSGRPTATPGTEFDKEVLQFLEEWASPYGTVHVQTSGSTGAPKILRVEKQKMRQSAKMTCQFLNLHRGTKSLLCLPVKNISGKMMLVRALEFEHILTVSEPLLNPLNDVAETFDFCALTPLQAEHSIDKLHLIGTVILGGAAVSKSLSDKITSTLRKQAGNHRVFETFGMSETLSHIALKEIYPNKTEYFTTLHGAEISTDPRGCLTVFAPHLHNETLITNDIVEIKDGKSFRFLGRADNVINSGGAKIYPEELEAMVKQHIPNEVVFIGLHDEAYGQKLVAVVEGIQNNQLTNTIMSLDYGRKHKRPKMVLFENEIPRTANGKVDRRALMKKISSKND